MEEVENDSAVSERRINDLEKEYEAANTDPKNRAKLEELHFQIPGLLGKNNLHYLREYTDRLIAQVNKDPEWFYKKGMEDTRKLPHPTSKAGKARVGRR